MRSFLILLTLFSFNASAEEFVLKWGVNVEPIIYFKKAAAEFKQRVEEKSKGRIKVELYENSFPQDQRDHLADVQKGIFDMSQESVFELESKIPELDLWNLPYLFTNEDHVTRYINSAPAKDLLAKLDNHKVLGLGYTYSGGFLHVVGKKIDNFNQLSKLNVGFEDGSDTYVNHMKKLFNLKPLEVNFDDLKGSKPAQAASEIIISTARDIYPLAKNKKLYLNATNHRIVSRILFISHSFLKTLPEDLKKLVIEEGQRAAVVERALSIEDKIAVLKEASKHNVIVNNWNKSVQARHKEQFLPLYEQYNKKFSSDHVNFIEGLK